MPLFFYKATVDLVTWNKKGVQGKLFDDTLLCF